MHMPDAPDASDDVGCDPSLCHVMAIVPRQPDPAFATLPVLLSFEARSFPVFEGPGSPDQPPIS